MGRVASYMTKYPSTSCVYIDGWVIKKWTINIGSGIGLVLACHTESIFALTIIFDIKIMLVARVDLEGAHRAPT